MHAAWRPLVERARRRHWERVASRPHTRRCSARNHSGRIFTFCDPLLGDNLRPGGAHVATGPDRTRSRRRSRPDGLLRAGPPIHSPCRGCIRRRAAHGIPGEPDRHRRSSAEAQLADPRRGPRHRAVGLAGPGGPRRAEPAHAEDAVMGLGDGEVERIGSPRVRGAAARSRASATTGRCASGTARASRRIGARPRSGRWGSSSPPTGRSAGSSPRFPTTPRRQVRPRCCAATSR